jgi:hypothetical protein
VLQTPCWDREANQCTERFVRIAKMHLIALIKKVYGFVLIATWILLKLIAKIKISLMRTGKKEVN